MINRSFCRLLNTLLFIGGISLLVVNIARADRLVLSPRGIVANPESIQLELLYGTQNLPNNIQWVTVGLSESLLGLELEAERAVNGSQRRTTFSAAYSFVGSAFTDLAPALSIGVRDVLDQGRDGRAFYAAASKTFGLSERQEKFLRKWTMHAGYGTSHIGGVFVGVEGRLSMGFTAAVEFYQRRLNTSVTFPVLRHVNLKAATLNGQLFYGATLSISR